MSTVEQIEAAIRALPARERDRLAKALPALFPELGGDTSWDQIICDGRPRPALSRLLDEAAAAVCEDPARLPETTDEEFKRRS
jgi:hypothetical protein